LWVEISEESGSKALSCVNSNHCNMKISSSLSLVITVLLVIDPITLLPSVFENDICDDDGFACPLAHALELTGLAAQPDACTGGWSSFMQ
jgi:hypothetical protein